MSPDPQESAAPASGDIPTGGSPLPYAAFAGCSLIWGSTFLVIRIGNDSLPPLWAATLRLAIAAVLLTLITLASGHRLPRGAALRAAVWFGALNFGVNFCLLYWGETRVPSGLSAVFYATIPVSSALFARLAGLERPAPLKLVGAVVALGGVAVIFSDRMRAPIDLWPTLAVLAAATTAALSGVMLKRGPRQHPLAANAAAAWTGLAICAAASAIAGEAHPVPRTAAALWPLLYLATVGSIAAFGLYAWLVNRWPVSRVAFVSVLVPVIAVILGAIVLGEALSRAEVLGAMFVMAGLGLAIVSDARSSRAGGHRGQSDAQAKRPPST